MLASEVSFFAGFVSDRSQNPWRIPGRLKVRAAKSNKPNKGKVDYSAELLTLVKAVNVTIAGQRIQVQ